MIWLSKQQVIALHSQLIEATGGADGLRDEGLLESSILVPFQSFDSIDLFPSIISKAARLGYGLTHNHPFIDGNKRVGAHAMLVVLALNNIPLNYTQTELSDIFLSVASGESGFDELHDWVLSHIVKSDG